VSPAAGNAVIDACTLQNFAVVDRLDLLKERFTGHAYWTEAIQYEAGRLGITDTGWLGHPIEVGDGVAEIIQIQAIRRALGARRAEPKANLSSDNLLVPRPMTLVGRVAPPW
jgi:hypothetical protein